MGKILRRYEIPLKMKEHGKVVATNGCFDVITIGHKRLLEQARSLGDALIVALNDDESVRAIKGEPRPIIPAEERAELLAGFEFVDYVTIFHGRTAEDIMKVISPAIFVKGDNTNIDNIPESEVIKKCGGEIVLLPITEHVNSRTVISKLGGDCETKPASYTLYDRYDRKFVNSEDAAKENIVLTAHGKVMHYAAGIIHRDGQRYPEPVLRVKDLSFRYDPCMKIASG